MDKHDDGSRWELKNTDKGVTFGIKGERILFAGILYAGHQIGSDGRVVTRHICVDLGTRITTDIMINLGICVKSSELAAFDRILLDRGVKPPVGYTPPG
jgi:hypothetical protein